MMRRAGVSITITSLTSFLAFAFGAFSSLPALSNFCWTTCFGILFTYLNQLTFFSALIYYDLKRIYNDHPDFCWACQCKPRSIFCCKGHLALNDSDQIKKSGFRKFLAKKYVPFIVSSPFNFIILLVFFIFFVFSLICASQLTLEFNIEWFLKEGGQLEKAFNLDKKYFGADQNIFIMFYTINADFEADSQQLTTLRQEILECRDCS